MFEKPRAIVLKPVEHAWVFQGSECGTTTHANWAAEVSEMAAARQRMARSRCPLAVSSCAAQLLVPLIAEPLNIWQCLSHTSALSFSLANFLRAFFLQPATFFYSC